MAHQRGASGHDLDTLVIVQQVPATITGSGPLTNTSNAITISPGVRPIAWMAFAPPTLPLPSWRMSAPRLNRTARYGRGDGAE